MKSLGLAILCWFCSATSLAFTTIPTRSASGGLLTTITTEPVLFLQKSNQEHANTNRRDALTASLGLLLLPHPATAASSGARIDVNNALAREYTAFPGLFPTVATKIVKGGPYTSKKQVYAVLNDLEADRLRQYDNVIVINKPDAQLKQFKTSQICKYECGNRVSSSYQNAQIKAVQDARR